MNNYDDFIYMDDEALSGEMCKEIVEFVKNNKTKFTELMIKHKKVSPPREIKKQDDFWFYVEWFNTFPDEYYELISKIITKGASEYIDRYPVIFEGIAMSSPKIKYHVVHQHGGYHAWHSEWAAVPWADSILTWHLSLTDHKEEGELEFLYYGKRIESKAGRLLVWPSYFPWTHRGNSIRTETEKHYFTGWWSVIDSGEKILDTVK